MKDFPSLRLQDLKLDNANSKAQILYSWSHDANTNENSGSSIDSKLDLLVSVKKIWRKNMMT